jgi:hypothetical protein
MGGMLWYGREARWQTEKTNVNLRYLEKPVYSTQFISIIEVIESMSSGKPDSSI